MKYAFVNNQRVEAQKGMKGICPVCQQPVIAKCGQIKVNHWAHSKSSHCDKSGGNRRPSGIGRGRIISQKNGRKLSLMTKKLARNT